VKAVARELREKEETNVSFVRARLWGQPIKNRKRKKNQPVHEKKKKKRKESFILSGQGLV